MAGEFADKADAATLLLRARPCWETEPWLGFNLRLRQTRTTVQVASLAEMWPEQRGEKCPRRMVRLRTLSQPGYLRRFF